jgi:mono/diheme cytochrome c family protein
MKLLRWTAIAVVVLLLVVAAVYGIAWWKSERDMQRRFPIVDPSIAALAAEADLTHGRYLFETRGCGDCHAMDGRGRWLDSSPVIDLAAPNITPAGLGGRYDADAIAAAVRHGIRPDGRPLLFMPANDWDEMSDADVAAIAAYVLALPPVDHDPGAVRPGPLGRVLYLFGQFPLLPAMDVDHAPRQRRAPVPAATVQYGFYVAQTCTGCHGIDFAGAQRGPRGTPRSSDLRPGARMDGWNEADFVAVMRTGRRPDGSELHPFMPWETLGRMTDVELVALWKYFQTLPPAP